MPFMTRTLLIALATAIAFSGGACAADTPSAIVDIEHLNLYGAVTQFVRDDAIPGKEALRVKPRPQSGDEWASGTSVSVPFALKTGQRLSGVIWARAEHDLTATVTLHGGAPEGRVLAAATVNLTPQWHRFTVGGRAPTDLPASSQFLTLALGKARGHVLLGPVMFAAGKVDEGRIRHAFASFRPASVVEDVAIKSEPGVVLAATLRKPMGHGPGPFPAILLLSGSGPSQRYGITPFQERLLRDGIAILTYDKRGVGQSTGQFVDTLGNMETDAAAAISFLRQRPDLNAKRIAVAGHSQGGAVGPAIAARDPGIAAVVMFAGPVAPPVDPAPGHPLNLVIMRDMLARAGASPAAIDQVSGAAQSLFEARSREAPQAEMATLRKQVVQGFIACGFSRAGAQAAMATLASIVQEALDARFDQTLARVHAPVLAIYGLNDVIVPAARHAPIARHALAANRHAKVVEFPDLDHGLRHVKTISLLEQRYTGPIAAPEVIRLAGDWLDQYLIERSPRDRQGKACAHRARHGHATWIERCKAMKPPAKD